MSKYQKKNQDHTRGKNCQPGCEAGPLTAKKRLKNAYQIRKNAAEFRCDRDSQDHPCNGDEAAYAEENFFANFTKGLPHHSEDNGDNIAGEVIRENYCQLLKALKSGEPDDFKDIELGCPSEKSVSDDTANIAVQTESRFAAATLPTDSEAKIQRPLVNPQAALAYDLEGFDSHQLKIAPAPAFSSAEAAGEMIELYWMALARDVAFENYGTEPITQAAVEDINNFIQNNPREFKGLTVKNPDGSEEVTPQTLFRGKSEGVGAGNYISQFLLLDVPFGAQIINQKIKTVLPAFSDNGSPAGGCNYMTTFAEWLDVQNGCAQQAEKFEKEMLYIRNGRDLGQYVHVDVLFQAYFNAMLLLVQKHTASNCFQGLQAPFDAGNPYPKGGNQEGFGTFGGPHIATLVCEVATRALKAVWFQKWAVHRRLRPEEYGGRLEKIRMDASLKNRYPIHSSIFDSAVLDAVENGLPDTKFEGYQSHLLPMAFPEGSPVHPAYGAGHATVAGACVTILKAWFNEKQKFSDLTNDAGEKFFTAKRVSADGKTLEDATGDATELTVGGELNKLAANIGIGRNHAGVHWRSDHDQSIRLGEQIAISILEDQVCTFNEEDFSFTFTTFDGQPYVIEKRRGCTKLR